MASQQGFPNVQAPFTDAHGFIQQSWLQFLISLWVRTGSGPGTSTFTSGDIKESAAIGTQAGWLECDGSAISRSTYSSLFAVIGTTYGSGDGSTTFNIPDYRGRFLLGTSGSFPIGTTGGSTTETLTTPNLPAHNHPVVDPGHTHTFTGTPHTHTITDPGHVHASLVAATTNTAGAAAGSSTSGNTASATTDITINSATATGTNAVNTTGITTGNTGSGTPFSIIPPYAPVTVLIKI